MKTIGIIGGIGPETTVVYYRQSSRPGTRTRSSTACTPAG
jgi:aspartate/glutamate racemase